MRLPRRVPWASLADLEQLCASIYGDKNDIEAKIFAINRISAWKAITMLPHAVESTLAILVVIVQDQKQSYSSSLALRQSYATAIIRLVNGLVDPLQVGTYARSIISIAQQLGLPGWLVELRHAATHEDLPSLDLLREASRQSMAWLLHNYFLPILNPVSAQQIITAPIRPLAPILKVYKNTMKIMTRDVSLVNQYKPRILNILRDIERWISEAKVAANANAGDFEKGYTPSTRFCPARLNSFLGTTFAPYTSYSCAFPIYAVSTPRFNHLDSVSSQGNTDPSYLMYIACWVSWAMQTWNESSPLYLDLKKDTLANLMKGLGYNCSALSNQSPAFALLQCLTSGQKEFETIKELLLKPSSAVLKTAWDPCDLDVMKERQALLQSYQTPSPEHTTSISPQNTACDISIPGWRTLRNWRPSPIDLPHPYPKRVVHRSPWTKIKPKEEKEKANHGRKNVDRT
ncbi:Las1-like-domain-containing protein [Pholiota molesta]|nr:Las1-like-domain-containing protein [Pholiota molesta]